MTAWGAMTVPLPMEARGPMTAPASMMAPASTCADGIDMGLRRDPGFAGHRSRRGGRREQQPADHGESLLRSRVDQNRDAGRRLGGEFGGTKHGRRLQRLHQREIALAVDEDERALAAFDWPAPMPSIEMWAMVGIDKRRAGQIRDFASRIPA